VFALRFALFIQVLWRISYTNRLPLRALAFVTHSYTASSQLVMTPQTNDITDSRNSSQAKAPASVRRGLNVQEELQQLRNGDIQRNSSRQQQQQQQQQQRAAPSSHVKATTVYGNSYPTSSNHGAANGTSSSSSSR
jgi:hypothetical protein